MTRTVVEGRRVQSGEEANLTRPTSSTLLEKKFKSSFYKYLFSPVGYVWRAPEEVQCIKWGWYTSLHHLKRKHTSEILHLKKLEKSFSGTNSPLPVAGDSPYIWKGEVVQQQFWERARSRHLKYKKELTCTSSSE